MEPSWDYVEARGIRVQGSKWMHLLLKAPKGTQPIRASLDLAADVKVRDGVLPVLVFPNKEDARAYLTVKLV